MAKKKPPSSGPAYIGFLSDAEIASRLSMQYRVPVVDLGEYEIDAETLGLVAREQCEARCVIPVSRTGRHLILAMPDPADVDAIEAIKASTGYQVEPVVATEADIRRAIARYYRPSTSLN